LQKVIGKYNYSSFLHLTHQYNLVVSSLSGVDVNLPDGMSRTALHLAAWKGDPEMVQLLLRAKASTSQKARDNFSALHFASQSGSLECCKLLVTKNPKLLHESITKGKKKPLHLAAAKNNFKICQFLLNEGADPAALTSNGQTALDFAKDEQIFELIKASIAAKIEENGTASAGGKKRKADEQEAIPEASEVEDKFAETAAAFTVADEDEDTAMKPHSVVLTGLSDGENLNDEEKKGAKKIVAMRKTKKQKVQKKITKLSCYDDEDAETED
jgi:ankyrin repeat protein